MNERESTTATLTKKPAKNYNRALQILNRYSPPIFISLILLAGHFSFGILESYKTVVLAVGASIITDLVLGRIIYGK